MTSTHNRDDSWPTAVEPELDECVDDNGDVWPEHDYGDTECRRCGAEPDDPECE